MRDYIEIGSTPCNEPCVQLDTEKPYLLEMLAECKIYKRQLEREFPTGQFKVKCFNHYFGDFYQVVAVFDTDNVEEEEVALLAESEASPFWDEQAKQELHLHKLFQKFDSI